MINSISLLPPVKTLRPFGLGLQRKARLPLGPSLADRQWWAAQNATYHSEPSTSEPTDARWDALADEAMATAAHERGLVFA